MAARESVLVTKACVKEPLQERVQIGMLQETFMTCTYRVVLRPGKEPTV